MKYCPTCQSRNAADADRCRRCGKYRFYTAEPGDPRAPDRAASGKTLAESPGRYTPHEAKRMPGEGRNSSAESGFDRTATESASDSRTEPMPVLIPRLEVVRGIMIGLSFALLRGKTIVGRSVDGAGDIDLADQEPPDRVLTSRRHCCVHFEGDAITVEDLNSLNGTFLNRQRMISGQPRRLGIDDVIQLGAVQLRFAMVTERWGA